MRRRPSAGTHPCSPLRIAVVETDSVNTDAPRAEDITNGLHAGSLEVRLARCEAEVVAAQALRYRVFFEEMDAVPSAEAAARRRDFDQFDEICDHLLVIDHESGSDEGTVVGTYRLLRRSQVEAHGRFYTADEYDIAKLIAVEGEILELGRSCVDGVYRNRATIQLLLRGIVAYVQRYDIVLMFGCASIPGVEQRDVALPLSWLYHNHLAPPELRPRALPGRYISMNLMPPDKINRRAAVAALPPLIKGYLRAGCFIGDGAVIDHQFRTIDVCIVLRVDRVADKYRQRYDPGAK
ncbi:MAG: GNAT family N-acetyltransferase [Proteobacteria bacterium]|nr:GNAT family N-acetyltransferase [Pseudomonadota bacterium]